MSEETVELVEASFFRGSCADMHIFGQLPKDVHRAAHFCHSLDNWTEPSDFPSLTMPGIFLIFSNVVLAVSTVTAERMGFWE
ncbi:hypothetical protein BaRGS_00014650 [Batillaria attramentaria]|uniref:Uncharacterized protein n=1 Tax=Batillaria attramentaria TaxID=370345 RepID=A0ABD0L435_9CAEN